MDVSEQRDWAGSCGVGVGGFRRGASGTVHGYTGGAEARQASKQARRREGGQRKGDGQELLGRDVRAVRS